ncbi:unnamed protein product [Echinostoma caproni]|uniref:Reverse transcriptase domain-containing protein n=1 Tax=Echinostoma caproni TaxID=27848 RepID=A0A183BB01_9TREM|nr:unnamed protein product [Echinostoma caproni]
MSTDDAMRLVNQLLTKMEHHLVDLQRHQETLSRKGDDLQRSLAELDAARDPTEAGQRFVAVRERSTVFGVASLAMVNDGGIDLLLGGRLSDMKYADDIVLLSEDPDQLQAFLYGLSASVSMFGMRFAPSVEYCYKVGLTMSRISLQLVK